MNINKILGITESYKAPEMLLDILHDKSRREKVFKELLVENRQNIDKDLFHEYFENEHADRKVKKQDFTPNSVSDILSQLTRGDGNTVYDVCCGTGGITIRKWWDECKKYTPFTYYPSEHLYICEELSDRAIPFLLVNLMIRGMNAAVIHCDSLTRECKGVFYVKNDKDDHLAFSNLYLMPYNSEVEEFYNVKFKDFRYPIFDTLGGIK